MPGNLAVVASLSIAPLSTVTELASLLGEVLSLGTEVRASLNRESLLFGNLPELDSMAVATVLTAIEDRFGILIDDDEISGELFETIGSLADFIEHKRTTR